MDQSQPPAPKLIEKVKVMIPDKEYIIDVRDLFLDPSAIQGDYLVMSLVFKCDNCGKQEIHKLRFSRQDLLILLR